VRSALEKRRIELVGVGTYMRDTTAVKTALLELKRKHPEAIIVVGAYLPSAVFTQWARKLNVNCPIFNMSFVGSEALAGTLGAAGDGVYITQVVPFPTGDAIPLLTEYREALLANEATAQPSFGSLEGYIAGRLSAVALALAGASPTRESFLSTLHESRTFDIGGFKLSYGPGNNRGSNRVFLTAISRGTIVPVDRLAR
jgi:ABC-type branched-subunit amino acid transport system substrate-binding protein